MYYLTRAASLLLAVLIACAATDPAFAAVPNGDACALLTPTQVSAVIGVPVGAGSYLTPTIKTTCTWRSTAPGGGWVTLVLQDVGGFEDGKQLGSMGIKNMSVTSLRGVGDDAYYLAVGGQVGLIVKKGNAAFKIAVYAETSVEDKEAKEKVLAEHVVSGL